VLCRDDVSARTDVDAGELMHQQLPINLAWFAPLFAGVGTIAGITWASIEPACNIWGEVISRGPADSNAVALTFDDGPTSGPTDAVLDALQEIDAPAAFFVVGANVRRWPGLVRRMHEQGHIVANHSFDHSHYGFYGSPRYWRGQIDRTDVEIVNAIGLRPAMFRPPMGVKTFCITGAARRAGQRVITWTRRGYDGVGTSAERITQRLGPNVRGGEILVLHDGVEPNVRRDPSATVAAVRPIVRAIRERGLNIVRLDELIGMAPYAAQASRQQGM
jgi:peptidoglycan-N-acetylglucosamine deacetylase